LYVRRVERLPPATASSSIRLRKKMHRRDLEFFRFVAHNKQTKLIPQTVEAWILPDSHPRYMNMRGMGENEPYRAIRTGSNNEKWENGISTLNWLVTSPMCSYRRKTVLQMCQSWVPFLDNSLSTWARYQHSLGWTGQQYKLDSWRCLWAVRPDSSCLHDIDYRSRHAL